MGADDVPALLTERLFLTIPGGRAAEAFLRFNRENEPHLAPWSPRFTPRHFDAGALRESLDASVADYRAGSRYAFCIFERGAGADGPLLGYLNFSEVVRGVFQACYMGYALAESAQGRGYMTEAAGAGVDFIFSRVGGFSIEGTAREYLYLAGAWQDHVLTSLTNPRPVTP